MSVINFVQWVQQKMKATVLQTVVIVITTQAEINDNSFTRY